MRIMSLLASVSLSILVLALLRPELITGLPSLFQFIIGFIVMFSIFYAIAKRDPFGNIVGSLVLGKKILKLMRAIEKTVSEITNEDVFNQPS